MLYSMMHTQAKVMDAIREGPSASMYSMPDLHSNALAEAHTRPPESTCHTAQSWAALATGGGGRALRARAEHSPVRQLKGQESAADGCAEEGAHIGRHAREHEHAALRFAQLQAASLQREDCGREGRQG